MEWYKVGVKFTEQQEDSTFKRVKKYYLVQAASFTDAEMRTHEVLKHVMRHNGKVVSMAVVNAHKIIEGEADQFFQIKVQFEEASDDGKKPKVITHNIFMRAFTAEEAVTGLRKQIKYDYPGYVLVNFAMSDVQHAYPLDADAPTFTPKDSLDDEDMVDEQMGEAAAEEVQEQPAAKKPVKGKGKAAAKAAELPEPEEKPEPEAYEMPVE